MNFSKIFIILLFISILLHGNSLLKAGLSDPMGQINFSIKKRVQIPDATIPGTWTTDNRLLLEFISEEGYYIGMIKGDPDDTTSRFLHGEAVVRMKQKPTRRGYYIGRLKVKEQDGKQKWVDSSFKVRGNGMFDGRTLYRKILNTKLKIKKRKKRDKHHAQRQQALKQIKSSDWKQRREGISTLEKIRDEQAISHITPLLFDRHDRVARKAYKFLKKANKRYKIAGLNNLLKEASIRFSINQSKKATLDGLWQTATGKLSIYFGNNNQITLSAGQTHQTGLYISDGESQLAMQLEDVEEQIIVTYDISGFYLRLSSSDFKQDLILKKIH